MEECISAIWSLSLEDENEDLVIESAIPLIIESLQKHKNAEKGEPSLTQQPQTNIVSVSVERDGVDLDRLLW